MSTADTVIIGPGGVSSFPSFAKKATAPVHEVLPDNLDENDDDDIPEIVPLVSDGEEVYPLDEVRNEKVAVRPDVSERPEPVTLREAPKKIELVEEESEGTLYIYKEECLNCKHLFPKAKKIFSDCHFTPNRKNKMKGNADCPAQSATIEIYLPIEKAARGIVANTRSGNMGKVANLYRKLEDYSLDQRQKCTARIAELLQETTSKKSGKKK